MEGLLPNPKLIFLVGAPRSGTTWLQLLLSASPAVATANETHLFSAYLCSLFSAWKTFEQHPSRAIGLKPLMSEEDYLVLVRDFASKVLARILETNPSASVILEKTPDHVKCWREIISIFPSASFIHLIRDPRGVAASLCAASRGWGSGWASHRAFYNAAIWTAHVRAGREIANATPNYLEVRYEDLKEDGVRTLQSVYSWCGLGLSLTQSAEILSNFDIEKLHERGVDRAPWPLSTEPDGFYRKGETDSWKVDLTPKQIYEVECIARDLMAELEYLPIMHARRAWRCAAGFDKLLIKPLREGLASRFRQWGVTLEPYA